jgi:hypothetical protein
MSTLLIDELYPGQVFSQKIKISKPISIAVIRPWIYKQGTLVDGDFQLEVLQGATVLITKTIGFADINSGISSPYAHGYIKFEFDVLQLNVSEGNLEEEYTLRFSMINHTLDTSNYIAIVREWDDKKYIIYGDQVAQEPQHDFLEPAGYELYVYRS